MPDPGDEAVRLRRQGDTATGPRLGALAGGAQPREERLLGYAAADRGEIGGARAEPGNAPDPQPLLGHPQPVHVHQ